MEKEIFAKEYDSGLYGIVSYYFSKLMVELPLTAIFPTLFIGIIYYIVNFNNGFNHFLMMILGTILMSWVATLLGVFIGTIVPTL